MFSGYRIPYDALCCVLRSLGILSGSVHFERRYPWYLCEIRAPSITCHLRICAAMGAGSDTCDLVFVASSHVMVTGTARRPLFSSKTKSLIVLDVPYVHPAHDIARKNIFVVRYRS